MARRKSSTASNKRASSKGLGDTVEKVTKATGIKKAVDWFSEVTGVDCGCDKRKEKLNELFPYKQKEDINCLNEQEYEFLKTVKGKKTWRNHERRRLNEIHSRVFNQKLQYTSCSSCIERQQKQLLAVASTYEQDNA